MIISELDKIRFYSWVMVKSDPDACHEWVGCRTKEGYGDFKVGGRDGQSYHAHRIAYEINIGVPDERLVVRHNCDNPPCCNYRHLTLGTHADNVADRVLRERSAIGLRNGRAKVDEVMALEIITLARKGHRIGQLAKRFDVDPKTIRDVVNGRSVIAQSVLRNQ